MKNFSAKVHCMEYRIRWENKNFDDVGTLRTRALYKNISRQKCLVEYKVKRDINKLIKILLQWFCIKTIKSTLNHFERLACIPGICTWNLGYSIPCKTSIYLIIITIYLQTCIISPDVTIGEIPSSIRVPKSSQKNIQSTINTKFSLKWLLVWLFTLISFR